MGIKALQNKHRKDRSLMIRASLLCCALLLLYSQGLFSQVITNEGAAISVIPGTVVSSGDLLNNPGGNLLNNGTINLSGNYTSIATSGGDGLYTLGGSWTNSGGIFIPGASTVIFNGSNDQFITRAGGETFYNLSVENSGAPSLMRLGLSTNVNVLGTLTMSL